MTNFLWGTVIAITPLSIQLDGDTAVLPYVPDSLIDPLSLAVGNRVRCEMSRRRVVIHGISGGWDWPTPQELGGGTDLNNLQFTGTYRQGTTANATLALNYPVASVAGVLVVVGTPAPTATSHDTVQRFFNREGAGSDREWIRTCRSGTWTAWREIGEKGQNGSPYAMAAGKSVATSASTTVTVTFPSSRFAFAPAVAVTPTSGTGPITPVVTSLTATSFALACVNAAGTKQAVNADWMATQMLSSGTAG